MKLTLLLLCLLSILSLAAQPYGQVKGQVRHADESIFGATVSLTGVEIGVVTDEEGRFLLDKVPPGVYWLQARYLGFREAQLEVTVLAGAVIDVPVELEESSLGLREVVVTGTMKGAYVSDSPVKIDVVTARQLETYLPVAAASIMESVQLVSGVQEVVACGVCYTNSISINGLPGPYTAVLLDGMPVFGNLASVYGLNGIPAPIIERFEVIKGPNSTLYGSEAMAGVINIITKDPARQPPLVVDVMGTSHGESFGNIALAPRVGRSAGFVGLNYAYINDYEDSNGDGFGDAPSLDRLSLFTKWNVHRPSGRLFSLAGKLYYEDRRNGVEAFMRGRAYRNLRGSDAFYGESIYTWRGELFGSYQLLTAADVRLDFSLSSHAQDSYYGADHYVADQRMAFANFTWREQAGSHSLLAGLTSRYQYYDDNTVATAATGTEGENRPDQQFIPGIFVQDEWTISSRLTLLAGARLDHYEAHGLVFSPRLSAKYKPGTWTTMRFNTGTGFRVVNLFTEDHAFVTGQREVVINGELHPERSFNAAFNVNHVYLLGRTQGSIDLEAYYTYFTNKITPDYDTPGKIIYANTDGHARTAGLGISLTQEFAFPLAYNLGINVQQVTQTEPGADGRFETTDIPFAPHWSGIFSANYRWKQTGLTFAYTLRATGPMALPEVYDLDPATGQPVGNPRPTVSRPFFLQNLQVAKNFSDRFQLYAGLQNLGNYRQRLSPLVGYNDPMAAPGFSGFFDTAYAYSPLHGREFYLGIRYSAAGR